MFLNLPSVLQHELCPGHLTQMAIVLMALCTHGEEAKHHPTHLLRGVLEAAPSSP